MSDKGKKGFTKWVSLLLLFVFSCTCSGVVIPQKAEAATVVDAQARGKKIAAGQHYSLALKNDGSVVAWGNNGDKQCNVPASIQGTVVAIAAGQYHSLALTADGRLVAWGRNNYVQCNVPEDIQGNIVASGGGESFSLALTADGWGMAWGYNNYSQCDVPELAQGNMMAITTGYYHALAIKADGSVIAWGRNNYGQCNVPAEFAPNKLASLVLDKGELSPAFNPDLLNYTVDLSNTVKSIKVTATLENLGHTLLINDEAQISGEPKVVELVLGLNTIRIGVQSEQFLRTYIVTVHLHSASLLAEWHLDESIGTLAKDTSGMGKDGVVNKAAWVKGIKGNALHFDGVSSYVHIPEVSFNDLSDWTIEAWVYPEGPGCLYSEGNPNVKMQVNMEDDDSIGIGTWHDDRSENWNWYNSGANVLKRNKWNYLVITLANGGSGTDSGTVTCYVNGNSVGTRGLGKGYNSAMKQAAIGINVGFKEGEAVGAFKGIMDEVSLYHYVLSPEEVQKRYNEFLFVKNLKITSIDDQDLTKCVLNSSIISKLTFDLNKSVNILEIGLSLPSIVRMEHIMGVKKDGVVSDSIDVVIKGNKLVISQGEQPLLPGNYEIQIFMYNDNVLTITTEFFSDIVSDVNYPSDSFMVEIADLPDIL